MTCNNIYYNLIEDNSPKVIVLGESEENWTNLTCEFLKGGGVTPHLLSWSELKEVRLSCDLIRYPVIQVWSRGELKQELIGYNTGELRNLIKNFYYL